MNATYTKLRDGSWGVKVTSGSSISAGAAVNVTKRDGSTKAETIDRVVWQGDGAAICSIKPASTPSGGRARSQRSVESTYQRKYGWDGVRGSSSYYTSGMYDEES